jgi:hypothetical protein
VPKVELVDLLDKDGKTTGFKRAEIGPLVLTPLDVPLDVTEAFYTYHDGLLDLVSQSDNHDLDGNYARLAEKALRVSILLASISGAKLGLEHWARAQEITERWRVGLHELYNQINEPALSEEKEHEETLLSIIQKLGGQATAAEAARYVRNFSSGEAARILDSLVDVGELSINTTSKGTRRYILAKNESQS